MKYDERTCKFNMDTGCVELLLRDGRKISIDCTGVEDALDVTMSQRAELDYLIYNCMSFSEKSSKLIAVSSTSKIAVWTLHKIWERPELIHLIDNCAIYDVLFWLAVLSIS